MPENNIIFDLGFHYGEDSFYYLYKGYKVVAVDAALQLVRYGHERFSRELASGQLIIRHAAIASHDEGTVPFYISENSQWNSAHQKIAERKGLKSQCHQVPSCTLAALIKEFGVPYYCKIDIEGNDIIALESLQNISDRPQFISVETECIGDYDNPSDYTFQTLDQLAALGYRKFKLVDQLTLQVLDFKPFYTYPFEQTTLIWKKDSTGKDIPFHGAFPGSSGPFGNDLLGTWYDYENAKRLIQYHALAQRSLASECWSFWCDWHASF